MRLRGHDLFATVRSEGGLLPPDLLGRIAAGAPELPGLAPSDYHLDPGERLNEAINRSWARLTRAWEVFSAARVKLGEHDPGTTPTRERWLLPLFQELGYGRLPPAGALAAGDRSYPISHAWQHTPIHLVGCRIDLDRRERGVRGAATASPHGLVQDFLNRSDEHLWAFVSNGLRLRVLRDHASLTRQALVEFDLEAIFEDEVYADFVLLWLACHQSRVEAERPELCWLERWSRIAQQEGTRALEGLRKGVERAIEALGRGFLAHPENGALREALRNGSFTTSGYYRELLRLVYRLLFLLVAEDRGLLVDPNAKPDAKQRYLDHYSTARLRRLASRLRGSKHADLYYGLRVVMAALGRDEGAPGLALPPLGGLLWSPDALVYLDAAELANRDILEAVRALATTQQGRLLRAVDYKNLGPEELGSVYESLLELHPEVNAEAAAFALATGAGHERKVTGSYYTPSTLIECLLDTALEPVLDEKVARKSPEDAEQALLSTKVCDPACGSGHFLIAAAHRIARRLAAVRTGEEEPSPDATRKALRDVISHCLYGVDLNPMAVELCKVSLWLEALVPSKPLSFLDHHIQCGNSLLGTTPALLAKGIPDEAFEPIEGDDKKLVSALRKQNREERKGQTSFFTELARDAGPEAWGSIGTSLARLDQIREETPADVRSKEERYRALAGSPEWRHARLLADAWCAAFVWRKAKGAPEALTQDVFRRLARDPDRVPTPILAEVDRLTVQYGFLHWHLAFPDVFRVPEDGKPENEATGWSGGFDVMMANPPWERIKLQEKEFFATRRPDIANAPNAAARRKLIAALEREDPSLFAEFVDARRASEGESHLVRDSGRYPLCGRGDTNTYAVFAELMRDALSPTGRVGCIVPTGIATDDTTKFFFQDLSDRGNLASLYDFENRAGLFPDVDNRMKFCLVTLTGAARPAREGAELAFFLHDPADLADAERRFRLSAADIALLNPNSRTCPIFRTRRDSELAMYIRKRLPIWKHRDSDDSGWGVGITRVFDMNLRGEALIERPEVDPHTSPDPTFSGVVKGPN